jgi:phosphopantothenoylcysteine decarboxylase/phosphopantothenate--cysteine ligase
MKLQGKKILLGVTGSIAAYKSAFLTRLFVSHGAEVQVVMTDSAHDFITPLTLSTLSGKPVLTRFSDPVSGEWNNHVDLGIWADAVLIAPATTNTLAKLAHGQCDDLLSAICLSARCNVYCAPAMDLDMFAHPSTGDNINRLLALGYRFIGPDSGELASGLTGSGRMTEPDDIAEEMIRHLSPEPILSGKKILVTAGPTREAIDPVRYISNHSSGKMGLAIAEEFAIRGAIVTLVCGPGVAAPKNGSIQLERVVSASEMTIVCQNLFTSSDITVMSAAVADYTPAKPELQKIKKKTDHFALELIKTTDILASLGERKNAHQILVGFALETENELENATDKLKRKNLDLIVMNSLRDEGAGFGSGMNKVTIIEKNNNITSYSLKPKHEVAADIVNKILSILKNQ